MLLLFVEKVIFITILTEIENHHFIHVEKTSNKYIYICIIIIIIIIIIFYIFSFIVILLFIQVTVRKKMFF